MRRSEHGTQASGRAYRDGPNRHVGAAADSPIGRPKLVGHLVHSPEKAGIDSGELVGAAPTGITATNSVALPGPECQLRYLLPDHGRA